VVGGGSPTATCCLNCRSDCAAICFPWSSSDFECGEIHVLNLAGGRASTVRAFFAHPPRGKKEGLVEFICQRGGREAALTFRSRSVHPRPDSGRRFPLMPSHTSR
jgi:hypothetical protein